MIRLKEVREAKGISQHQLARRTGVMQATISRIEVGAHEPRLETIHKLADGLGVEAKDLLPPLRDFLEEHAGSYYLAWPEDDLKALIGEEKNPDKVMDVIMSINSEFTTFLDAYVRREVRVSEAKFETLRLSKWEVSNKWSSAMTLALSLRILDVQENPLRDVAGRLLE